jgi:predicted alpha/beta hydrolase family esterase
VTRTVLTLPGVDNSGPAHWQSVWERVHDNVHRVEQRDWTRPNCEDWVRAIDAAVQRQPVRPIIVAHSLGCLAAAQWLARSPSRAHAVLLVAVPDPAGKQFPTGVTGFSTLPEKLLQDPLTLISSEDDPYASPEFSRSVSARWSATHLNIGANGHINEQTRLGEWSQAWAMVEKWRKG